MVAAQTITLSAEVRQFVFFMTNVVKLWNWNDVGDSAMRRRRDTLLMRRPSSARCGSRSAHRLRRVNLRFAKLLVHQKLHHLSVWCPQFPYFDLRWVIKYQDVGTLSGDGRFIECLQP